MGRGSPGPTCCRGRADCPAQVWWLPCGPPSRGCGHEPLRAWITEHPLPSASPLCLGQSVLRCPSRGAPSLLQADASRQPAGPWSSRLRTGACEMDSSQPMDSSMNQLINASIQPSVLPSADLPSVYSSIVCVPACPSMHPAAHLATHTSACPPITHPSTHPPIIHPALQPLTPTSSAKTGFTFLREWRMFSRGALSTSSSTTGRVFRVRERRGKGLPFVGHLPRVSVTLESCVLSLTCE